MWHEARKQERMIRGLIVDYRRRAERRKDFYEKIKAEPTQFLQLHGRQCKIHLDPAVAAAGEGPAIMMPWQGDTNNMIDRFDVRAHLDYIPEVKHPDVPTEDLSTEERQCNYERYRILAQNAFLAIGEDKFLQQLAIDEQFGVTLEERESQKEKLTEKKGTGAAIGYNYNDPGAQPSCSNGPDVKKVEQRDSDDDSDFEIIDVDLSIDVNKMEASQAHELNAVGPQFGMAGCDLFSFLTGDADDAEHQKQLLREEKEKAMFSGRKSRRERRAHRDKKLAARVVDPPSYAAPSAELERSPTRSPSRSPSPVAESIQFITSFGGEEDEVKPTLPSKPLYAEKLKHNLKKVELYADVARKPRPLSVSPERSRRPQLESRRAESRSISRSYTRSRSLSRSRSRSNSVSRSRSRSWRRSRSWSRSISRSRSRSRNYRRRSPSDNASSGYAMRNTRHSYEQERNEREKPVSRYYGRKKEDKSSSEISVDSDSSANSDKELKSASVSKPNTNQNHLRLSGSSSKGRPSRETVSLKEKLKRKMQAQLSRQLRADKRAEAERLERENRRQARRDEEMRELAIKLRRKQREMRHQQTRRSSEDDSDRSSRSSSRDSLPEKKESRSRSKSTSPLPEKRKSIPVWEIRRISPPPPPLPPPPPISPYRHRQPEEYDRRRYQDNEYYQERRQDPTQYQDRRPQRPEESTYDRPPPDRQNYYQNRYDKYPNKNYERNDFNRQDHYQNAENRWSQDRYQRGRRPYGYGYRGRGGYRGPDDHGEGPSWQNRDEGSHDRVDAKGKVKLVDY